MDNIFLEKTRRTPEVSFDIEKGYLKITGRATTENAQEFFKKIESLIENFNNETFKFEINIDYFNSSSSKYILGLLVKSRDKFKNLNIDWYSCEDDDDMIDFIESVQEILNHKIEIIRYD